MRSAARAGPTHSHGAAANTCLAGEAAGLGRAGQVDELCGQAPRVEFWIHSSLCVRGEPWPPPRISVCHLSKGDSPMHLMGQRQEKDVNTLVSSVCSRCVCGSVISGCLLETGRYQGMPPSSPVSLPEALCPALFIHFGKNAGYISGSGTFSSSPRTPGSPSSIDSGLHPHTSKASTRVPGPPPSTPVLRSGEEPRSFKKSAVEMALLC